MKTGRLMKFHRPGGEIHAYLYREGAGFRASVYRMSADRGVPGEPLHRREAPREDELEVAVRAYVDATFPK